MDTLDIFRQLTKGVRFTKRNRSPNQKSVSMKKYNADLKAEDIVAADLKVEEDTIAEEDIVADEDETMENIGDSMEQLGGENESDRFEFISGVTQSSKRPKKKKKPLTRKQIENQMHDEMVQTIRKENCIAVLGKNIPPPITAFEELCTNYHMQKKLVDNIIKCNFSKPTAIQMQAIPVMLKGRPLMACAPTGSGKTVAFLAPVINDLKYPRKIGFRALILAPTRELAQQIYRECVRLSEKTALKIHIISKINRAKLQFGENKSNKFDILISTPNRVRFLLKQEPPVLDLKSVEWLILDEADRLMEDGQNNFKEQLDDIFNACSNPNKKLALFSATYTVPVAKWALKYLKSLIRVNVGNQNCSTTFVEQELLFVGSESGKLIAIRDMVRNGLKPPVLVFVQSKDRAKQLFEELLYDGINVDIIHADRSQQQRENCVRAFREGQIWVLICTELMGRGIDFKGVNLVINYDFPTSTISYIHRIGRTGRAGRPGKAITFFTQDDAPHLRSIAQIIKNAGGKVPEFMLQIKKAKKSEKKKLANFALKREDISTKIETVRKSKSFKGRRKGTEKETDTR